MIAGCISSQPSVPRLPVAFKIGGFEPSAELTEYTICGSEKKVYLRNQSVLTNKHIASAKVTKSQYSSYPQIELVFSKEGKAIFAKVTRENIKKALAIIVDGDVITAPVIQDVILGGNSIISGHFTKEEANRVAEGIMGK